jgi:hypothetical protein
MHLLRRLLNHDHDNRPPDLGILLSSPDFMTNFHHPLTMIVLLSPLTHSMRIILSEAPSCILVHFVFVVWKDERVIFLVPLILISSLFSSLCMSSRTSTPYSYHHHATYCNILYRILSFVHSFSSLLLQFVIPFPVIVRHQFWRQCFTIVSEDDESANPRRAIMLLALAIPSVPFVANLEVRGRE